jgi:hypothetical protein
MDAHINLYLFNILVVGEQVLARLNENTLRWAECLVKMICPKENIVIVQFEFRTVTHIIAYDSKLFKQLPRGERKASPQKYPQVDLNLGPFTSSSHSSTAGKIGGGTQERSSNIQYGGGIYASGFTTYGRGGNNEPDHPPKRSRINESTQTPSSTSSFDVGISRPSASFPGASILSSTTPMRRCVMDPGAYAEESAKLIQRCDNATALIREIQARKRGEPDGM